MAVLATMESYNEETDPWFGDYYGGIASASILYNDDTVVELGHNSSRYEAMVASTHYQLNNDDKIGIGVIDIENVKAVIIDGVEILID